MHIYWNNQNYIQPPQVQTFPKGIDPKSEYNCVSGVYSSILDFMTQGPPLFIWFVLTENENLYSLFMFWNKTFTHNQELTWTYVHTKKAMSLG